MKYLDFGWSRLIFANKSWQKAVKMEDLNPMLYQKALESYCTFLEASGRAQRTIFINNERLAALQKFLTEQSISEIENVRPEQIDLYIASSYRKGLSAFTVAGRIQVIKAFFLWSEKRRYLLTSPARHLIKPHLEYRAEGKAISQEDLNTMILFARSSGKRLEEATLMVFADTGCRSGELCGISICDVDFSKREIVVRGKTGKRLLDFTEKTARVLKLYIEENQLVSGALFRNHQGGRVTQNQIYLRFKKIAGKLGIKRFNPHSIRHRVGQGWLDQGANLELVRQKLGHKDIQTTALFYSHQDRGRLKKATNQFSLIKGL